MANTVVDG